MSHWVGVSRYIHWQFTFSESLCGGFSLYTLTFTFIESLGGGFSLYTLTVHLHWVTGWGFLAIYSDISPSVSHWVGVSRYIHWHFTFIESTGWGFLAIYTDISPSVSHCVGVSRYIHWHLTFSESLGGGFSLYTLTFDLQWVTGWVFLTIYTDISPLVSHWVGVSRYIHWHFTFSESLGGGFSLYTLTFDLQWVTGWGFLAIYTDIWPSVSHWLGVSRYIHWHFTLSESLGRGFSAIYTDISPSVSHWVGVSR